MVKPGLDHLYSKSASCAVPSAIREINKLVDSPGRTINFIKKMERHAAQATP